jgi:hypothetical protein
MTLPFHFQKTDFEKAKVQWERSDRVAFMIMDNVIDHVIRGALPKTAEKANVSILMSKLMQAKYDGRGNVREHILKMIDTSNKLKELECPLLESYVVHYIMMSLPSCFENFKKGEKPSSG